ncbi:MULTISPECIES: DUF3626 domain-containing protein [Cohnella]|uniref:DUF3626 domain-containing protein n=1 Tax=Cohnella TaxID=329857 RepID=UPI00111A4235|nr:MULTISPECIES: DUF3626 domain-containing protein [Cohnella]MBN2983838.1 DUF3626 domain-containing protein [Cohnella algarum]
MSGRNPLTKSQSSALKHIAACAEARKRDALQTIEEILYMSDIPRSAYETALAKLRKHARIALHFHPDRLDSRMMTVAESLLAEGKYKSQFETKLSNGSLTAFPGGERDRWENDLFEGAYHSQERADGERPKYGALDLTLRPDGPASRFGSCYFLLSPKVSRRSTYTYLDSHQNPKEKGTLEELDDVMAALLKDAFFGEYAIGEKNATPRKLIELWSARLEEPFPEPSMGAANRNLNHYIEAQVHGEISLREDAVALVADPSFKGTPVGGTLERIGEKYGIDLYWHMGFVLPASEVPGDFRGPAMPSLARRISRNGLIDASAIGAAAADLKRNPEGWKDRGTEAEALQELKLLWHVLVRYGRPFREFHRG